LLASLPQLRRGMKTISLQDWFEEGSPPREITLDEKLDGRENAQALYDRARRLEDAAEVTARLLSEAEERLRSLRELADHLVAVTTPEDLEALGPAIEAAGLRERQRPPSAARRRPKRNDARAGDFRTFVSSEGYQILVGRSSAGNETVTKRMARGNDLWMHIGGGVAGSHVVVRLPAQKAASLETLLDAAHLAVHFSKARGRPACEVVYTQRKHVRKPKGFAEGKVTLDRSKTLFVRTEPERLRRVLGTGVGGDDEDLARPGERG
jgi:predicted ribosome quality control (RQC) complex YloA/Tae2 family protein